MPPINHAARANTSRTTTASAATSSELDLLPPALRMAATAGGARRTGPPTIRVPGKTKSFQLRKEQTDALAKIRCQPRQDLMTEEEQRKQTLLRRQTNKQRVELEEQERKRKEQSETIMQLAEDTTTSTNNNTNKKNSISLSQHNRQHDSWERTSVITGGGGGDANRSSSNFGSATADDLAQHAAALKQQAVAMRAKAQQLQAQAHITTSVADTTTKKKEHTPEILEKKLEKVVKLLAAETPGTKDYKKLAKKKEQYEAELEEMVMQELHDQAQADALQTALSQAEEAEALAEEALQAERLAEEKEEAAAAAERDRRAEQQRLLAQQQQAEQERKEQEEKRLAQERYAREQKDAQEKAKAAAAAAALEEEARLLRERAAELKAKRVSEIKPEPATPEPEPEPVVVVVEEVMDEKERIRQQRIEEFRRKQAEKKGAEEEAKRKEERSKEFKVLKKKLQKLEGMIKEAEEEGKDSSKLGKKKAEYIAQMEDYDEWQQELQIRRKAEELERLQKEREEAEKQRKAALEAERRQKAEEEAERRRKQAEEAQRERERLEKERKEEEERQRQIRLEEARRLEEEARAQRIREEEEAERRRIQEAEQAARDAEEAELRRIQEAEQAARDAEEAERRRIQQAEQAARDAEEAERRSMEQAERAARDAAEAERRRMEQGERAARDAEEAEHQKNEQSQSYSSYSQSTDTQARSTMEEQHETIPQQQQWTSEQQTPSTSEPASVTTSSAPPTSTPASQDFIDRHNIPEPHSANTKKILGELQAVEGHQARLEKTLKQNGIAVSEDIPYEVAKDKIAELQEQMKALATSTEDQFVVQKKYYALEEEMSKYVTAMMLTDEFAEEQRMAEQKWEESIEVDNIAALRKLRSYMPVNIRNMTEEELTSQPTPNGKILPKEYAKKFKRTNVLQLIRIDPNDLERMHPSLIEGLRSTGLTLTERRALHQHLKDIGDTWHDLQQDPSIERKYSWFLSLKSKFKEMVTAYDKHVQEYGPPGNHPYAKRNDPQAGGCPLIGNQCPVKADAAMLYDDDYGFTQESEYDQSGSGGSSGPVKAKRASVLVSRSGGGAKAKDEALLASIREKLNLLEPESAIDAKLIRELFHAEKRSLSLEKQLAQNGIALPKEDIPYAVAKAKVAEITEEIKVVASKMGSTMDMKEMAVLEKEYSQLSDELEKYNNALMLTKEWALDLLEKARQWEERVKPDNQEALRKIRRHMPVNIKDLSEQDMIQGITPNGKSLPQQIVRKFKRTNILQLLRTPPALIESMHPSSLESLRATGLTLTEQRALHEHLKELGAKWKAASNDKMAERKWMWHESHRSKFKELVDKYQQHVDQYGPPGNHPYAKRGEPGGGCPLVGKQCPLKADLEIDYSDDYGFPAEAVYNVETVKKSNLLTVEELERRKQDDDWGGHDAPTTREEPEPARPPTAGLMAALGSRGGGSTTDSGGAPPKMPTKMIAALAKGSDSDGQPAAPRMGGGLLAAIASKGGGDDDEATPKRPAMGGLLADIQSKATETTATTSSSDVAPKSPKKRMGGLLAAITGRGKKE